MYSKVEFIEKQCNARRLVVVCPFVRSKIEILLFNRFAVDIINLIHT